MTNQLLSEQWFEHLAKVTEAIGRPGFAANLFAALGVIRPIQATTVYLYPHDGMPCALFEQDDKAPWQPEGNVSRYLSGFYLLDPFYGACVEQVASGCYGLFEVAPDHFEVSEYYQSFLPPLAPGG